MPCVTLPNCQTMPNQTDEWITREAACKALNIGDRRLRDYIAGEEIHKQGELVNAGDVAKIAAKKAQKKDDARLRALATIEPQVRLQTRIAETRALVRLAGNQEIAPLPQPAGQPGNGAVSESPDRRRFHADDFLTIDEAAAWKRLPPSEILACVQSGELKARDVGVRPGGRYRILCADLVAVQGVSRAREAAGEPFTHPDKAQASHRIG